MSVLATYRRLARWPAGRWLFSRRVCWKAPYFASIAPRIEVLEPGRCVATIRHRRAVTNHLGTVHAIALCNLAEFTGGLGCDASLPPSMRWIPKGMTVAYLKTRRAFGAPLWDKQGIRQRISMRAAEVEAGRQLVYAAAWGDAQGRDVTREVSMAKAYCGELVNAVMYDCLQFHGGMGFMRESVIERMTRDARVQSIGGGATEVMLEEVAKRL